MYNKLTFSNRLYADILCFLVFEIFVNVKNVVNLIEINSNLNISTVVRMTTPHTLSSLCKKYKMFVTFLCRPKTF